MKVKPTIPDWIIGIALMVFFILITVTGVLDFTSPLEMKAFDLRAKLAAPDKRNPDIELVVIDDDDLAELGRFPWPRNILAKGIDNLAAAGAKVIALDIHLPEPEEAAGLKVLTELKRRYEQSGLARLKVGKEFESDLQNAIESLDHDAILTSSIRKAGNVVLPIYFDLTSQARDRQLPDFVNKYAYKNVKGKNKEWAVSSLIWLSKIKPLLPTFANAAAGIGHLNLFPDQDGYVRTQVHVLGYLKDIYFPSLPMEIVRLYKGLKDEDITVFLGEGIDLKTSPSTTIHVPVVDPSMRTIINWNQGPGIAFHETPFRKVFKNEVQTSLFRDKIVIIGPTAPGIGDKFVTPVSGNLPGVEIIANSVANILNQRFISRPPWVPATELIALILFGIFISFLLPRMKAAPGAISSLAIVAGYSTLGFVLFLSSNIWLRIIPQIMLLILGYLLVISKRFLVTEKTKEKVEADSIETNKMLGLSFQQQGMLDLAFEKFRKLPIEEEGVKDLLYNLGLDYERKRQFSKALATYQLIAQAGESFRDLDDRIPKLKHAEATLIFGGSGTKHPGEISAPMADTGTRPTLGRYEIIGEIGRGAMGVVYKGQDPKIRRTVAIKTLNLTEFEESEIPEIKERFFREAESAGLLTHPNIVTIYDCGEEQDLAYIAMEYLEGEDLLRYTKKGNLLPIRDVLDITAKVADALGYAHSRNVVHRDIKPANIMRLKETGDVKVTDFGIARITSSSKTKTGVVMGTPSYMSPEQLSGKKVDGRSDIFSLGIVLFELLTGEKPFKAQDMTSLMYKIAQEPHPSAKSINPKIPTVVEKIIDKALEKDLNTRYQSASQMAEQLRLVVAKMDEIARQQGSL
ncbi:MAG: serine/threonine protein kinase [Deltaproteobacteria bacterium]|nr:MAG: serine/threonine protein kinase [Deltaproteobacteria bacterium]RLB86227.1 MAG: serine/threonine protein kinase [Deltaproteobacteria bacterium]